MDLLQHPDLVERVRQGTMKTIPIIALKSRIMKRGDTITFLPSLDDLNHTVEYSKLDKVIGDIDYYSSWFEFFGIEGVYNTLPDMVDADGELVKPIRYMLSFFPNHRGKAVENGLWGVRLCNSLEEYDTTLKQELLKNVNLQKRIEITYPTYYEDGEGKTRKLKTTELTPGSKLYKKVESVKIDAAPTGTPA